MTKKTIAILFGGHSAEYEVSLKSAYAVINSLNYDRYKPVLIGITREGEWLKYSGPYDKIIHDTWQLDQSCVRAFLSPSRCTRGLIELHDDGILETTIDAAFPVMHGRYGEDGTVQGLLELAGIPIIGCDSLSSSLCMDKAIAHTVVQAAGIRVAASITADRSLSVADITAQTAGLQYPLFVKPLRAGSSFGISMVQEQSELVYAIDLAFQHDSRIIIEERIEGFEVGCAVLGKDELVIGEVDEIELSDRFFDYKEKYSLASSKIHMPARIDAGTAEAIKHTAAIIYRALRCSGFARVDLFLTPQGELVFNEVNTIPGFTPHSRYPNMLRGIGMTFEEIVNRLISEAMNP